MNADDAVEFVKRAELLSFLRTTSADADTLDRNLSASRSTIHRATQSLTDQGLVEKDDGVFELTSVGAVVAARTEEFQCQLDTVERLEPLLEVIDAEAVGLPLEHLADATVERPCPGQPHVVVGGLDDLVADAESMRMFSGVVSPIYVDIAHEAVQNGTEIQAVFRRGVVDDLFCEHARKSREAARTGRFEVRIHDDCPFELFLFDDRVGLSAHDDRGLPVAFVETSNPVVVEWAESCFARYWDAAEYATII
jgi:predicted transcriptional regulator